MNECPVALNREVALCYLTGLVFARDSRDPCTGRSGMRQGDARDAAPLRAPAGVCARAFVCVLCAVCCVLCAVCQGGVPQRTQLHA